MIFILTEKQYPQDGFKGNHRGIQTTEGTEGNKEIQNTEDTEREIITKGTENFIFNAQSRVKNSVYSGILLCVLCG